jgi:hypothetical protein
MEEIYIFGLVFPGGDKEFAPLQNAKTEAKALCVHQLMKSGGGGGVLL